MVVNSGRVSSRGTKRGGAMSMYKIRVLAAIVLVVILLATLSRQKEKAKDGTSEKDGGYELYRALASGKLEDERNPKGALLRDVKLDFTWSKDELGAIMIANFTIHNPTQYRFKDFEIKCTHFAPSGTVIDSNTRTLYEVIRSNSTSIFKQFNMGFINSQAAQSSCKITDLVVLPSETEKEKADADEVQHKKDKKKANADEVQRKFDEVQRDLVEQQQRRENEWEKCVSVAATDIERIECSSK